MYKATINKGRMFEFDVDHEGQLSSSAELESRVDIAQLSNDRLHLIYKNRSYNAEVVEVDMDAKSFRIKINGKIHQVTIKDKFDLLLERLGMDNPEEAKINNIKAPMPGLILDIHLEEGDQVEKGEVIMVLEAMKMENIIKSPGSGQVKKLHVQQGDSVEKNQVLIEF